MSAVFPLDRISARRGRQVLDSILEPLDIRIDGSGAMDIRVGDERFYTCALPRGTKGMLDAYVDGWWECEHLDELAARLLSCAEFALPVASKWSLLSTFLLSRLSNRQNRRRSLDVRRHYDLGNDLFMAMLDSHMMYSCGYWKNASSLEEAQRAKLELICRKLGVRRGMRILDIGCGWGGFARYAAQQHGASVVGITIADQQLELGRIRCKGLPVELRLQDYRDLGSETFDAVVSIGMFEHVGYKNYRRMMEVVRRCLNPDGLFLLHTIGSNRSSTSFDPWLDEHVFPNAMIPSARQIATASEGLFVLEDWHNFGPDYDKTLMAWYANFRDGWSELRKRYDRRFYRMWRCYLLTCAGSFRARKNQLWQIVFSPRGVAGGYRSIR
jgi:cyclopropane-fatty-acyl-phospholipid synthase